MQIRLLGGVCAFDDIGEPIDIGPAKSQAVVAALALSPGATVSVARLVAMVWGDDPPRTADKTLQSYVTRLRKELGDASIVRVGAAYRFDIDPEAIDVVRFQRKLENGDVNAALAEWTGPPFEGLDAEGLAAVGQRLIEQWLAATEQHVTQLVDTDPAAAIGQLTELTANHPFRENLCALLMTALYRVGRQADALAVYRTTRHQLVEALGVEPGPELRALEQRILEHEATLSPTRSIDPTVGVPGTTVTLGFTDVDDATRAWVNHPHESAAALARHEQLVRRTVDDHAGRVVSSQDSSFAVIFDTADSAAAWARDLQAKVRREPWPRGVTIRVRIGLHSGETTTAGGSSFGAIANLASCLAGAAHGGQTLVSAATASLLGDAAVLDLGTFRLDGVPGEQRVHQLDDDEHPPIRSADDRRRGNLPRRSGRLIGRDKELRVIESALAAAPVVTLVGPGGIGKTSLATAVALAVEADFDGGAWLVELAPVANSIDVARAIADTIGVREGAGRDVIDATVAALRERRALVVLDNCEHVIDGSAAAAHAILNGCPRVQVLATSRERLGLAGEQVVTVGPLEASIFGVELFRERATALDASFDARANRGDIEQICRRLDGVPLAIELAAARVRTLPPADLLARLDDSLRLLTGGSRSGVEHHRTLRAAIEWSYDLLSPSERTVFARLSAFAGPFDLTAAEAVASDETIDVVDVDEAVARLVDQSMLQVEPGPFGRRFLLLESMRQFAADQADAIGDAESLARQHAHWCIDRVNRIHELLAGPAEIEGVARLSELWPNLRAAVDWSCRRGDGGLARSLVAPIAAEVLIRSQTEIADWAARILTIAPPDDSDLIVFALALTARRFWRIQDPAGFERLIQQYGSPDDPMVHHARALVYQDSKALVTWCPVVADAIRRGGDDHLAQLSDIGLPRSLLAMGRFDEGDAELAVLEARYRANGPPSLLSWVLTMSAYSAAAQGDRDRADRLFEESASIEVPQGTHSRNRPNEAIAALRRGDRARALLILRSDVEDLLENDDVYDMAGTAIAFMSTMATLDRCADAARVEGYLDATRLILTPILRGVATDAVERIAAAPADVIAEQRDLGRASDGRETLTFMRSVLEAHVDA